MSSPQRANPASSAPPPGRGRPRSARSELAVVTATQSLLAERGLTGLTMDAVAERAGVSKATVYKWWSSKGVLALDALMRQVDDDAAMPDSGDLRTDLTEHIARLVHFLRDTVGGRTVAELIGQGQQDPATAAAVREAWIGPRRRRASVRIDVALARGELRPGLDGDLVLDLLYGPVYYRLLVGHGELSDDLPGVLVDAALRGVAGAEVPGGRHGLGVPGSQGGVVDAEDPARPTARPTGIELA